MTSKGQKRLKRTSKADREKWKRELSDIVCSWIGKPLTSADKRS